MPGPTPQPRLHVGDTMSDIDRIGEIVRVHQFYWGVRGTGCMAPGCEGWRGYPLQHARHVTELIAEVLHPHIETAEQLDALPLDTVVVDAAGIPRTRRHGDSHMGAGWTHAGRSPLKSHELADGRPMRVVYNPAVDRA
ncbi:Gp57 [Mycolicibacterium brisbanense]|uniref:Gp57 n=2 Tax=Mycolicibacterium brisbanense TaxID=146020 RepID=A0A100W6X1_9MYCO|nr:Gp57 [Mycolicibacterium brisbanense]